MLFLIRHGEAGDKHLWDGLDATRPLTEHGRLQAAVLVPVLASYPVERILTSPTARCVQTVEPLARARRVPVATEPDLDVNAPVDAALALVRRVACDAAVLCTHGEILGSVLRALLDQGVQAPPGRPRWEKGSVWVVDGLRGATPAAAYLPPSP